ncbi:MAG: hypothetical protein CSA09_05500 [Candidatus Contendobacter odensis]|uniref:Uncharacterized protein n=1 Tax=Candidatus Contendibacter odensensis TaxID=1400860 RepID=A0A2G6PDX9_9GAMM|nr:MAG: hypothetical protein CSA09_05500 [Candidatus Contendobacter odensis]
MRPHILLVLFFYTGFALAEEAGWWEKLSKETRTIWAQSREAVSSAVDYSGSGEQEDYFSRVWQKLTPNLEKITVLEDAHESLPDSSLFGRDKQENQEDINQLLDEAIRILQISDASEIRKDISAIEEQVQQAKQRIATYRQEQVSAPVKSGWKTTMSDYDKKIAAEKQLVVRLKQEIDQKKQTFLLRLHEIGLQIDRQQLDLLLASVVGDDAIQSSIVYNNVKLVSQQLMELTRKTGEDINISRRYYGMYTILLKILLHMQNQFITEIDDNYRPSIARIEAETRNLMKSTRSILDQETLDNRRRYLEANFQAQKLTLKTADLYKKHLDAQHKKIVRAKEKIQADLQVAMNTYHTVKVSGDLVSLMRSSSRSFDDLLNIQVPDLLVFENVQMKDEFSTLTARLKE